MSGFKEFDDTGGTGGWVVASQTEVLIPGGFLSGTFPAPSSGTFPQEGWSPTSFAQAVLAEFLATSLAQVAQPELPTPDTTPDELAHLAGIAGGRNAILPEMLARHADPLSYWADMLGNPRAKPRTMDVIAAADLVGRVVATHFKAKIGRLRPAQLAPGLMPPILTPALPSFPGGHATALHLVALMLAKTNPRLTDVSLAMANRGTVLRESLGHNYPSDGQGGKALATSIAPLLLQSPRFTHLLAAAVQEW